MSYSSSSSSSSSSSLPKLPDLFMVNGFWTLTQMVAADRVAGLSFGGAVDGGVTPAKKSIWLFR